MSIAIKFRNAVHNILYFIITGLVILFFIILGAAQLKSCFISSNGNEELDERNIVGADYYNIKHRKVLELFDVISQTIYIDNGYEIFFFQDDTSINAASFGNGIFMFWESLSELPEWVLEAIITHEIAHDLLLHSRKMRDLDDLRNFFVEIIGLGAERETEKTLHEWSGKLVLPIFSRKQELEADRKAVELLRRVGYDNPQNIYIDSLRYLRSNYGNNGGGFFDTHPSIDERIMNLKNK